MMKNYKIILLILSITILTGCGKKQDSEIKPVEEIPIESLMEADKEKIEKGTGEQEEISLEDKSSIDETEVAADDEVAYKEATEAFEDTSNNILFSQLKNIDFSFMSGAGAWGTELIIEEDGSFRGIYHDSEMGLTGEEYPMGSRYYSSFHGKLKRPVMVDEFTYSTAIESIIYDNPVGSEEIIDGIKYLYSEAYGLDPSGEILIYLPGIPVERLSEEYLSWVIYELGGDSSNAVSETELPFYGLYNVEQGLGFSSYNILTNFENNFQWTNERAKALEDSLEQDVLTQQELNETAQQLYHVWDDELNNIWNILKRNLPDEEMDELTKEQLKWITMKEESMKNAGKEVEGGSMYGMVVSLKGAELTKDRVYLLLEKIEKLIEE